MTQGGHSDVRIHDLDKNPIAVIALGPARVSFNYVRIIHHIDLKPLELITEKLMAIADEKITDRHILSPLIKSKQEKLLKTFGKLKSSNIRRAKRWESLGKAWKYISGSPDAEDLKIINTTTNTLIEQNNKQMSINKQFEERINNITKTVSLLATNYYNETLNGFESVNLLFNIDDLINHLEIVEEAITLARFNIPSSRLISSEEIFTAQQFLTSNNLEFDSFGSILDIASAYVLRTTQSIVYTLKIPRIKDVSYELDYIEPVISNGTRVHLSSNYYLKGPKSYHVQALCPKTRGIYICQDSQLEVAGECIQQLMSGSSTQCMVERTYGQNFVKRINEANIVVNDANMTMLSSCFKNKKELQGSFLIQFSGCTINLNGEEYTNLNAEGHATSFIPTTGLKVNATETINRMPLEYLQILHLNHREHLEKLNLTTTNIHGSLQIFKWLSFGSFSVTTIIIFGIIFIWVTKGLIPSSNKTQIVITEDTNPSHTEDIASGHIQKKSKVKFIPQRDD